jgi:hypothetical protein
MTTLPEVRVGDPIRHEALTVFPLFSAPGEVIEYLLSDEAIDAGSVTVEEVSEGGSVPNLLVSNTGDWRVLFLEGEELKGAKQNRVLNTSVLVAARSKTSIPVSCVEQGRWRYRTKQFSSGGSHSSSKLRSQIKGAVSRSLKAGRGHASDQGAVWGEVSRQMGALGASSGTAAMADTYDCHQDRLGEFREQLKYVEGASGIAVAVGPQVVAVDVFDRPSTCRKVWDRLLSGVVMDALQAGQPEPFAGPAYVEGLLARLRAAATRSRAPRAPGSSATPCSGPRGSRIHATGSSSSLREKRYASPPTRLSFCASWPSRGTSGSHWSGSRSPTWR